MENLKFSGQDTVAMARQYGTPLYVMSEDIIRKRIEDLKQAFDSTGVKYDINYAGKAFTNLAMCRIVASEGISLDVVSKGEMLTALKAGFPTEHICFHGNNKTPDELAFALEHQIGRIIVDSEDELEALNRLTTQKDCRANIMFRVSPGVEAHTHELIETGTEDSKFGLPYVQAREIILKTKKMPRLTVVGLHCHIGSQIVSDEPFVIAAEKMIDLYRLLQEDEIPLGELNLGGGFGIPYLHKDEAFDVIKYIPQMVLRIKGLCDHAGIDLPKLIVEPGRYIVAESGVTLYTVGTVKKIPGLRTYVSVDGGMNDNPRPALYGAEYEAYICNAKSSSIMETVTVSGRACENDILIDRVDLNRPEVGDTLMISNTGAYNYSMSSNYNRYPRPAVVLISGNMSGVIVKRETDDDLLRLDRIPKWLSGEQHV